MNWLNGCDVRVSNGAVPPGEALPEDNFIEVNLAQTVIDGNLVEDLQFWGTAKDYTFTPRPQSGTPKVSDTVTFEPKFQNDPVKLQIRFYEDGTRRVKATLLDKSGAPDPKLAGADVKFADEGGGISKLHVWIEPEENETGYVYVQKGKRIAKIEIKGL